MSMFSLPFVDNDKVRPEVHEALEKEVRCILNKIRDGKEVECGNLFKEGVPKVFG